MPLFEGLNKKDSPSTIIQQALREQKEKGEKKETSSEQ